MVAHTERKRFASKLLKSSAPRAYKSPASDPQQLRLYAMEREEIGCRNYARLSFANCKRVVKAVCRQYGVPVPQLLRKEMYYAAEWWKAPGKRTAQIVLSTRVHTSHDLLTVLHELAHHLHFYLAEQPAEDEDHGIEFMACYISILDTVRFLPKDAMATICDRRGIKYLLPGTTVHKLKKVLNQ